MEQLRRLLDYLPIVQKLRKDPKYVEWDAYDSFADEDKEKSLSSGPLKGSRGLAIQVCSPSQHRYITHLGFLTLFLPSYRKYFGMKRKMSASVLFILGTG